MQGRVGCRGREGEEEGDGAQASVPSRLSTRRAVLTFDFIGPDTVIILPHTQEVDRAGLGFPCTAGDDSALAAIASFALQLSQACRAACPSPLPVAPGCSVSTVPASAVLLVVATGSSSSQEEQNHGYGYTRLSATERYRSYTERIRNQVEKTPKR